MLNSDDENENAQKSIQQPLLSQQNAKVQEDYRRLCQMSSAHHSGSSINH